MRTLLVFLTMMLSATALAADRDEEPREQRDIMSKIPKGRIEVKRWVCHPTGNESPWVVVTWKCKKDCPPERRGTDECLCEKDSGQLIPERCGWAYGYLWQHVCANVFEHGRPRHHWWALTFEKDAVLYDTKTEGPSRVVDKDSENAEPVHRPRAERSRERHEYDRKPRRVSESRQYNYGRKPGWPHSQYKK